MFPPPTFSFSPKRFYGASVSFKGADESSGVSPTSRHSKDSISLSVAARDRAILLQYGHWQSYMVAPYANPELNEALSRALICDFPLGSGGVHVAFPLYSSNASQINKPKVLKMDIDWLRHWIRNYTPALISQWVAAKMRRYIDKEREHIQEFKEAFHGGKIIVPEQSIFMGTVELDDDMLLQLGAKPSQLAAFGSMPTYYRLVPYIRELNPNELQPSYNRSSPLLSRKGPISAEDFRDIKTGYAEIRPMASHGFLWRIGHEPMNIG